MNTITKTNNTTPENKIFNKTYELIDNEIPFDSSWNNGTSYFNGAQRNVVLPIGTFAKSYCTESNRKLIMLGTRFGTFVVFERYSFGEKGIFVGNCPVRIKQMRLQAVPDGRFGYDQLTSILGLWGTYSGVTYQGQGNISEHLDIIAAMF